MLVNIIQNTISSFISGAAAAAEVITTNLKMWLGFETSETLGREEVVDGDFPLPNVNWTASAGATIESDGARINNTVTGGVAAVKQTISNPSGKTFEFTYDVVATNGSTLVVQQLSNIDLDTTTLGTNRKITFTWDLGIDDLIIKRKSGTTDVTINNVSLKELTQITPDKSGNNNVGELFTGKSLEFNGSTNYVSANSFSDTLSNNTAFTFAVWFNSNKPDSARNFQNILISSGGASQSTNIFKIGVNPAIIVDPINNKNPGGIYFDDSNGYNNQVPLSGGVNYNDGEWHRLVVSRPSGSGVKDLSFYVDGSLIDTAPCNPFWNNMTVFDFGQEWDPAGTSDHFEGNMSDIQVYNYAWDTDDVTYDYANPNKLAIDNPSTSLVVTNLKGYWAMSEGAGSLTYDSSGEGNNGTIIGATYEPNQPRIPQLGMQNWSKGSNLLKYSEDFSQNIWTKNNLTQTYGFTSPTGILNATKLTRTNTNSHIESTVNITTVQYNTASIYVKGVSGTIGEDVRLYVYNGTSLSSDLFTLTGDWQRITHSNSSASGQSFIKIKLDVPNVTNGEVLVWGGQLEESSLASAYRLTDGEDTSNSTVIANPTIPTKDIFGNLVRDRLNSFNLDGSGYATNESLPTISGNISISFWVKLDTFVSGNLGQVVGRRLDTDSNWLRVYRPSSSNLKLEISATESTTFNVTENQWVNVAITINSSNQASVYVDNSSPSTETFVNSFVFSNTISFSVGAWLKPALDPVSKLNGLVSDVLIYDRVLTSDEVENNYNAGLSAHTN